MTKTTRTLNPIHFEDLEPHRFEDLVRQLIYDVRDWKRLEALGRSGADEGFDVRGVEQINDVAEDLGPEGLVRAEDDELAAPSRERVWLIQCKRERAITPARAKKIVDELLIEGNPVAYGFMLVAA